MSTYYRAFHKIYPKHEMQPWPQLNVIIGKRINQTGMLLALTYADSFKSVSKSLEIQVQYFKYLDQSYSLFPNQIKFKCI